MLLVLESTIEAKGNIFVGMSVVTRVLVCGYDDG